MPSQPAFPNPQASLEALQPPAPASGDAAAQQRLKLTRRHLASVRFSATSYLLYAVISGAQVGLGLMSAQQAVTLTAAMLFANAVFYAVVRTGITDSGRDPGLARTQLVVGMGFMYAGYALIGPAASGLVIIIASHIVYAMFSMSPRAVWRLVVASLLGLGATMLTCHQLWPQRYAVDVQAVAFLYACLVVPMIALLAGRVAGMNQRLQAQRAELEQAFAELKELASRDELTRVHNRHHMTNLLVEQRDLHRQARLPMSLALIDLDLFKRINDEHGHSVGDDVLRRFAGLAKSQLRAADQVARWGGEEFLVALPHTARDDAVQVLERLQAALADPSADPVMAQLQVSFSAGIVELKPDESLDAAIERADQAMYAAKRAGRRRTVPA
jgi:diguanylate cyclase